MNWWRSLSFIHEARFIGLFSLLWSAKTPLKVCDTSSSMIGFCKLTFFGFNCGFTSSSWAMRDMVTADSDWGTSKLVLAVGCGQIDLFILSNLFKYFNLFGILETLFIVQYPIIKWKNSWLFLKSSDCTITNMQRFAKSHQTWFAMKKN